ncbi:MAG: protein kinase [Myxococcales bacterium]|nr:protein kinase [Myxococcales bacterium]
MTEPHGPWSAGESEAHGVLAVRREASPVRLLPGALVPGTRYRLRRWLGDGGMGVVYEAEHVELERPVALKILRAQIAEHEDARERFRKEARTTTRIISPHVVQVLDFGLLPDGRVFYAMELLDGRPLSAEISDGPIAPARAIGLLRQICAGLAAAHRTGVIHRDVKPDNTMLVEDRSGRACVKLLDFGISSSVTDPNARRASGTPDYMAPEQIEGKPFDVRLDVYALGCTAYEMLTGAPPFRRASTIELIQAHLEDTPSAPSRGDDPFAIPPALAAVVMRCLAKEPADRFASMEELEAALCEAQIDAGLQTDWDDLPLPEIAPEARARLAARMPQARSPRIARRRWIAGATAVAAAIVAGLWLSSPRVDASDHARVERLVAMTRAAAERGIYVYPPPGEPTETAYISVITLEHIEGPAAAAADEQAAALRRSLAAELVALGDGYWDDADARAYARDYYAQAVLFDPGSEHARERAGFTRGELTELRARAEAQDFTEPELVATAPLIALALVEPDQRGDKVSELARAETPRASSKATRPTVTPTRRTAPASTQRIAPRVADDDAPVAVRAPGAIADREATSPSERTSLRRTLRKAQGAVASGDLDTAQRLFDQVLAQDPDQAAALRGLAEINLARGKHDRAVHYARRATQLDPEDGLAFVRLGDGHRGLNHRLAARRAYARAEVLGRPEAAPRLRELDAGR